MIKSRNMCRDLIKYKMKYLGWTGGTDPGKAYVFMNEKKEQRARAFAHTVMDGANVL